MGFPVAESEDMPDIEPEASRLWRFPAWISIVDRVGSRTPRSLQRQALRVFIRRVGGGVQDFDAIKLLKFGATC